MEQVNAERKEMEEKARIREQEAIKLAATKIKVSRIIVLDFAFELRY